MQERNGGVEGRFTYTEAGFNDYFNFPSSVRVILIALQSGHAILALPNAVQRPVLYYISGLISGYNIYIELGACNLGQKVIHTADSHLELEKSHDAQGM